MGTDQNHPFTGYSRVPRVSMGIRGLTHSQITAILLWTTDSMAFDRWRSCARNPQKLGWATTPKRAAGVSGNPWAGEEKIISISVNIMYMYIYIYVCIYIIIYIYYVLRENRPRKVELLGFWVSNLSWDRLLFIQDTLGHRPKDCPGQWSAWGNLSKILFDGPEKAGARWCQRLPSKIKPGVAGWKGYQLRPNQWNL